MAPSRLTRRPLAAAMRPPRFVWIEIHTTRVVAAAGTSHCPSAAPFSHAAAVPLFHDEVAAVGQAQLAVGFVGARVVFFDVKTQPDDAGVRLGLAAELLEQGAE